MSGTGDGTELNKPIEDLDSMRRELLERQAELDAREKELRKRERELTAKNDHKEGKRKQIILRLPESLWRDIADWAEYDFRSVNSQIEYILTRSVREHEEG